MYETSFDNGWDYGPGDINDAMYSGGTGEEDFDSNLFNEAPQNWYEQTYGMPSTTGDTTFGLEQSNYQTLAPNGWQADSFDPTFGLQQSAYQTLAPQSTVNEGWDLGGIGNTLAGLFNSQGGQTGMKLLAALAEGSQNRKQASNLQRIAQQQTQHLDPFASQRPFYQQQLASTVQNPYSQPMVKSQVDQLARAQAIKDAAAGRRSNTATTAPALVAAQAQVAQQYMNSLMNPAGANINPSGLSSLNSMLGDAGKYDANGYLSPLASAIGFGQQQNSNQALLDLFKQAISQKQGA